MKNGVFEIFYLIGAFWEDLGAKTLLKKGFSHNSLLDFDKAYLDGV